VKALIQFFLDNNVVVHAVGVLLLIFAAVYISAIKAGDAGGAGVIAGAGTALIGIGQWRSK
jgi:hypothetical protein